MLTTLRQLFLLVRRDIRVERKSGEVLLTTTLFGVLVVVTASFAFYTDPPSAPKLAAGVLWLSLAFTGMLTLIRLSHRDREWNALQALWFSPVPRPLVYLAKTLSTTLLMSVMQLVLVPLVALFFHVELVRHANILGTLIFLGILGYASVGTLFSTLSMQTRARELALSIVLLSLTAPALICGVVATRDLIAGAPLVDIALWIRTLLAFDIVSWVVCALLFSSLVDD
jgi:heme exporter protein B